MHHRLKESEGGVNSAPLHFKGELLKRVSGYLVATIIAIAALIPPKFYEIKCTAHTTAWIWAVLIAGFLAFMFLFCKANILVKGLVLYSFINCFLGSAPYISFTMYLSVIACAYFYLLCLKIEDWSTMLKTIQSLFLLTALLLIMQALKKDTLLNFTRDTSVYFGTINNKMMLSSYIVCLTPFLIIRNKYYIVPVLVIAAISESAGMVLSLTAGIVFYLLFKIKNKVALITVIAVILMIAFTYTYYDRSSIDFFNASGTRIPAWLKTVELTQERPFFGYGIGTFKVLFPVLSNGMIVNDGDKWLSFLRTHNCWLQLLFELGFAGFILILGLVGRIIWKFKQARKTEPVLISMAGLVIYSVNMSVHFPTRMIQIVLILIGYLAYFEIVTNQNQRRIT